MNKKKNKKSVKSTKPTKKAEKKKTDIKGWTIGAKVVSIDHASWQGIITELDVTPEEFWKNAPTETAKRMSKYQYVRFVREDGCIFGMRKDMIRLIDE